MGRTAIHPGEILAEELEEIGLSVEQFALLIDVPLNRISQIIDGKCGISSDIALLISQYFGTSADFWMNLQTMYEQDKTS